MSWNRVRLCDIGAVPWRNGGGVTRELLAWPDAERWHVRLSVAEVAQDGPFSSFAEVRRWFAVLDGAGVRLTLNGFTHELTAHSAPFPFDGAVGPACELIDGPTLDFNLMSRGRRARMERVCGSREYTVRDGDLIAIYAHGTSASAVMGSEPVNIPPDTLAWRVLAVDAPVRLCAEDALWMEIAR